MTEFVVVSSSDVSEFKQASRTVLGLVSNKICGLIPLTFVRKNGLSGTDYIVLCYAPNKASRSASAKIARGFALLKEKSSGEELYIELICSNGMGRDLIEFIKKFAEEKQMLHVTLAAVPMVINFYRRLGFINSDHRSSHCAGEDEVITSLAEAVKDKRFPDDVEAGNDPQFAQFLQALIDRGLTSEKNCKTIKDCTTWGYTMSYCLRKVKVTGGGGSSGAVFREAREQRVSSTSKLKRLSKGKLNRQLLPDDVERRIKKAKDFLEEWQRNMNRLMYSTPDY